MPVRDTQVVIENARGRYYDSPTAGMRMTQAVLELLTPYVDFGTLKSVSASNSITLGQSATATKHAAAISVSAATTASFQPAASVHAIRPRSAATTASFQPAASVHAIRPRSAATTASFAQTINIAVTKTAITPVAFVSAASATYKFLASASSPVAFGPQPAATRLLPRSAANAARFATANYLNQPEVIFGDQYRGRFQVGQVVPLLVQARVRRGPPAPPLAEPVARIYGPTGHVETVTMTALRADDTGLFLRDLRLDSRYAVGTYNIFYSFQTADGIAHEFDIFEVQAGGDTCGPVISLAYAERPEDTYVLAQTVTGRLLAGRKPTASAFAAESVTPSAGSPEVIADQAYLGRFQEGRQVNLFLVTVGATGVPTAPDAEPLARIYGPSGPVATFKMVAIRQQPYAFRRPVALDSAYAAGTYTVAYSWSIGTFHGGQAATFEVDAGGDGYGSVISLAVTTKPEDTYVLVQTHGGRLLAGRKPEFVGRFA